MQEYLSADIADPPSPFGDNLFLTCQGQQVPRFVMTCGAEPISIDF